MRSVCTIWKRQPWAYVHEGVLLALGYGQSYGVAEVLLHAGVEVGEEHEEKDEEHEVAEGDGEEVHVVLAAFSFRYSWTLCASNVQAWYLYCTYVLYIEHYMYTTWEITRPLSILSFWAFWRRERIGTFFEKVADKSFPFKFFPRKSW